LLPVIYLIWSLYYGKLAGPNPWGGTTLEWQTPTTLPAPDNFPERPVVTTPPYVYARKEEVSSVGS
jgi:cytochrome c oxidase subunit 1